MRSRSHRGREVRRQPEVVAVGPAPRGPRRRRPPRLLHERPRRQAIIDVNRDGKADWLRGVPNVLTFDLADGMGGFTPAAGTLRVGDTARAEVLCLPVDIDGDGFIDLLVEWGHYGHGKGHSRVYRNDGQGNFEDVTERCGLRGQDFAIKGVADVNQDGAPDLIVFEDLKPEIYLNDGRGKFTKKAGAISGIER